jgi:3-hydroxybutyryl-CoA dehydrogenase
MDIEKIGIVGAGTMGGGIAQTIASAGYELVLIDVNEDGLRKQMASIRANLDRLVAKGSLESAAVQATIARIRTSTSYTDLMGVDLVIEAVTENTEFKRKVLQEIAGVVGSDAIIASNTSSISITRLAAYLTDATRFIGMHFFNPVPALPLVEIIGGLHTSPTTAEIVTRFVLQLGKTPIAVRNSPGFVVNRILVPMINEAFFVLAEGVATAEEIDTGMKLGTRQPMGPLALADLIGLDVCLSIMDVLHQNFGDTKYRPCPRLCELVAAGLLGRKTGRGVYRY